MDRDSIVNNSNFHAQATQNTKEMVTLLMAYEDSALEYFSDNRMEERILTHPKAGDLKERVQTAMSNYKNPFAETAIWIKGEMLDI